MDEFWLKQVSEPLYPEVIWSKPEQKKVAGKLLVLGGHLHGFDAVGKAYQAASESGAGEVKVALPDKLKKVLGKTLTDAVYLPSTTSGNLSEEGLNDAKHYAQWSAATLLIQPGDNSESTLLITRLLSAAPDHRFILGDGMVQTLSADISTVRSQSRRLWVLSFSGLQKLAQLIENEMGFRSDMGLRPLVLALKSVQADIGQPIVTIYEDTIIVAASGKITTTKRPSQPDPAMLAGTMAVWWMQQPDKTLQALTSAAWEF